MISADSASGGALNLSSSVGGTAVLNDLKIEVVAISGNRTVLRFAAK